MGPSVLTMSAGSSETGETASVRRIVAGIVVWVAVGEFTHWRTALRPRSLDAGSSAAVVVMGYGSRSETVTRVIQGWRVRVAARSLRLAPDAVLVFSGAAVARGAAPTEADQMADYAINRFGIPPNQVVRERLATSSWENVERGLQEAQSFDQVAFASDPFHVSQAHRYARKQRPEVGPRLRRGADYRFLEMCWLKPLLAIHAVWHRFRDWRFTRAEVRSSAG